MTNPILHRLAVVRRRYRLVAASSGVLAAAAFVVGAAIVVGLFDSVNHLPRMLRASALVGLLAGTGFLVVRLIVFPLARRSDNLSLALRIEELHPELNDALASAIQFLESPDALAGGDPVMRDKAVEKATRQAASFDFFAILDYRFLGLAALAFAVVVGAAITFLVREPELSRIALARLADPFGHHPWTRIDVPDAATRVAVGQPFRLRAVVEGVVPPNVKIEVQEKDPFTKKFKSRPDILFPVKHDIGRRSGSASTPLDVSQKPSEFRYRISANDGSFPAKSAWHAVAVLQPPSYFELDGQPSPQIALRFPRYTDLESPAKLSPGVQVLRMIQGTEVEFRAAVDRPLKSATLELKPLDANLRLATVASLIGNPALLPQIGPAAFHRDFSWFHPIRLDESRTRLAVEFRPWVTGVYAVRLVDDDDLVRVYEANAIVDVDPIPTVQMRRPAVSQSYLPTAEVSFNVFAEDDVFAVRNVFIEYRRKNAQGDWLDAAPKRIAIGAAEAGPKPKRVDVAYLWSLKKQFKPGDIIAVQAGADDYCDIFTPRLPGLSQQIELRIVGADDLARQLDRNLAQVQQELAAIKKLDDEAQKLLDEIPKDKRDPAAQDQAFEAAQKIKQVQERIGTRPDEGVRDKLDKIRQTIKDNKLPNSDVQDQVKGLSQELERLIQEDFPKLEQNLNDLRKDLAGAAKSKANETKTPLEKSKDGNREIQKTLGELTKSLDRWADLAQLKGQTRELMEKQKALAEETENLKKLMDDPNAARPQAKAQLREDAARLANQQKKLEQEAKDLIDRIGKVKQQQDDVAIKEAGNAEDGDKDAQQRADDARDAAKKLDKARGVAKQERLGQEMNNASEELRDARPNAAQQKQQQAAKTLDRMAKALEGEKDDDIDRLRKKQKQADAAQDQLDKLKKKVDQTQKNQKAGANANDRKEQAKDLRDAADELREQARQLQRLQEPRAARELQKAAENLEEAAKKLEAGDDAGAEQAENEARERIERAQQQLEHLQQELAREQLAQIGDRLKGLKERQDAAVERTNDLQAKVDAKKRWTTGLLGTLDAERQSQLGLAKETQSLEEKLKGAPVFEHILKKAGKAMEQAGDAMGQRKVAGRDRTLNDFDEADRADEKARHGEIAKLQKLAADRLDRLLEAIKDAPPPKREQAKTPPKKDPENKEPMDEPGGMRGGDGIPPTAQLKALKAEQVEVYERTKAFARDNPDPNALDENRQRELRELTEEQGRLRQLFEQMTTRREGDMP